MAEIKVVLFDLGGVLVNLNGQPIKSEWLPGGISAKDSWQRWSDSQVVQAYEKGEMSSETFINDIILEQGLSISSEQFVDTFIHWPTGLYPGVLEFLAELRGKITIGLYSNTSELHWPRLMGEMQLEGKFDHYFASFQIGMHKPSVNSFRYVADRMQYSTKEVFFVDDNSRNVDAARCAGMKSEQTKGLEAVKLAIRQAGIL